MTMLAERSDLAAKTTCCPACGQMTNITDHLLIDRRRGVVSFRGVEVRLTNYKFRLCEIFIAANRKILTNAQLIHGMYGHRYDGGPENADVCVRVYISKLRAALDIIGVRIVNVPGHGYSLKMPE